MKLGGLHCDLFRGTAAWTVLAFALGLAGEVCAQRMLEMRGFKYSEYHDAPQETKLKLRLQGARAKPLTNSLVLVTTARVETFREDGLPELVVEAPECLHSTTNRTLSSSGPLLVKMADGSFSITGEGFLYQQTNSTLFISNNVETVATPELLKKRAASGVSSSKTDLDSGPMRIQSKHFRYSTADGLGVYSGDVRVSGTNLALTSGVMSLKLPIKERRLHEISASENVSIDYNQMRATGGDVIFSLDTGIANVTGNPYWSSGGREGRADTFIIDHTNRLVHARGNAWLRIPGQSFETALAPDVERAPTNKPAGPSSVEVRADDYNLTTNQIVFLSNVTVSEFQGEALEGRMTCRDMTVDFAGTNQLERLVAEQDVVIDRADARFTAARAVYRGTNGILDLIGSPTWRAGLREGKGDAISVDGKAREMHVKGNASMRMPADTFRQQGSLTNAPQLNPASTNQWAQIFSEDYLVRPDRALFRGGVYITHPQMAWSCQTLRVDLPDQGKHVEYVLAEDQVSFTLMDDTGQKIQGQGDTAVYRYSVVAGKTNEQMQLSGNPIIQTTNGVFRNPVILYDLINAKVQGPGKYSIHLTVPAIDTNTFKLPK